MTPRCNKRSCRLVAGLLGSMVPLLAASCGSKSGLPIPAECTSYAAGAELAPLDVFIAMDTSGSMDFLTANGTTKYAAVSNALEQFMTDPDSQGIGVTIAFFPKVDETVPEYCSKPNDCGAPNQCLMVSACLSGSDKFCHTAADCAANDTCDAVGRCSDDPTAFCDVNTALGCFSGVCIPVGICLNHYACDKAEFAPVMPVAELPGAAGPVLAALASRTPIGGTPTLPALNASIDAAVGFTQQHPDQKSIVLLATDGLPTLCDAAVDPLVTDPKSGIPKLVHAAEVALGKGVQTFVIGVFAPDEAADADANLGQIAKAGGSGDAFVISTAANVSDDFLSTLNEIRRAAKACEFSLPTPGGKPLDATRLVVSVVGPDGQSVKLAPKASAADCDPVAGGFYFDRDPFGATPPGRVTLCPASCTLSDQGKRPVDLEVDCNDERWVLP
jgi:hypothetical protein